MEFGEGSEGEPPEKPYIISRGVVGDRKEVKNLKTSIEHGCEINHRSRARASS